MPITATNRETTKVNNAILRSIVLNPHPVPPLDPNHPIKVQMPIPLKMRLNPDPGQDPKGPLKLASPDRPVLTPHKNSLLTF